MVEILMRAGKLKYLSVTNIWLTVAAFVVPVLGSTDTSLKWKTATNSLIIGGKASLSCNGKECPPQFSKKWFRGTNFDLLCIDDVSYNPSKYAMTTNGSTFDLMIKNINLTDLNFEYTCACGFFKYTNMIKINPGELIYPPRVLQNSLKQRDNILHIDILVEVYPTPNCTLLFEDNILSYNISVRTVPFEIGFELYEVAFHHTIVVPGGSVCNGNLTLDCKVGSTIYSVCRHTIQTCTAVAYYPLANQWRLHTSTKTSRFHIFTSSYKDFICKIVILKQNPWTRFAGDAYTEEDKPDEKEHTRMIIGSVCSVGGISLLIVFVLIMCRSKRRSVQDSETDSRADKRDKPSSNALINTRNDPVNAGH